MNLKRRRVTPEEIDSAVARMKAIADQLRRGHGAEVTRLTMLKRLCEEPRAAARFGLYLATKASKQTKGKYRPLVMEAVRHLRLHVDRPRTPAPESLWNALLALEESQNERRRVKWTVVREIHSSPALIVEHAGGPLRDARPGPTSHR